MLQKTKSARDQKDRLIFACMRAVTTSPGEQTAAQDAGATGHRTAPLLRFGGLRWCIGGHERLPRPRNAVSRWAYPSVAATRTAPPAAVAVDARAKLLGVGPPGARHLRAVRVGRISGRRRVHRRAVRFPIGAAFQAEPHRRTAIGPGSAHAPAWQQTDATTRELDHQDERSPDCLATCNAQT